MKSKIISVILALALASVACGFSVDLGQPKAGPEIKESITVADPKEEEANRRSSKTARTLKSSRGISTAFHRLME